MTEPVPTAPPAPQQAAVMNERDLIVASATSLPDLIQKAEILDPAMANKLKGQAAVASATPVGALIGGVIGLLLTRYGLGLDADTVNLVSGLLVLGGGYVTHWIQARVTSIVPSKVTGDSGVST